MLMLNVGCTSGIPRIGDRTLSQSQTYFSSNMVVSSAGCHHCHVSFAHECLYEKYALKTRWDIPSMGYPFHHHMQSFRVYFLELRVYSKRDTLPLSSTCMFSFSFFSSFHQKTNSLVPSFLSFGVPRVFRQFSATIFRKPRNKQYTQFGPQIFKKK